MKLFFTNCLCYYQFDKLAEKDQTVFMYNYNHLYIL